MTSIGLQINGCTYHEKNGKKWIGLPARPYEDENGKTTWALILKFDDDYNKKFQKATLEALDQHILGGVKK